MSAGRLGTVWRLAKPIVAGLALAYLVTAFVDKPASVNFQPENPYAAQQSAIVKPQAKLVIEKNVMKLGSPLSVVPDSEEALTNPLARMETLSSDQNEVSADNATTPVVSESNATSSVRGEIEDQPEHL